MGVLQAGAVNGSTTGSGSVFDPTLLPQALAALLVAYVLARTLSAVLSGVAARLTTDRFRVTLLIPILKFVVYGAGAYFAITWVVELTTAQLVAFSGLLGAALGLGLKDLLADVIGGLVLVLEHPYRIGDKVQIGEHYGEVVDIGIRSTRLVTPRDSEVTVPNYLFFNESISNANAGKAEMLVSVEFYVDPEADVAEARRVVADAMATSQYVYVTDDHPVEVVVEDGLHYRTLEGWAYVNDLRNEYPFRTDVGQRVLAAFDRRGIESPSVPPGVGGEAGRSAD